MVAANARAKATKVSEMLGHFCPEREMQCAQYHCFPYAVFVCIRSP